MRFLKSGCGAWGCVFPHDPQLMALSVLWGVFSASSCFSSGFPTGFQIQVPNLLGFVVYCLPSLARIDV